jgi:hypothetical protein
MQTHKNAKMSLIFEAYAQRESVPAALRFLLKGNPIDPDQTPDMLELDHLDTIDCMTDLPCPAEIWKVFERQPRVITIRVRDHVRWFSCPGDIGQNAFPELLQHVFKVYLTLPDVFCFIFFSLPIGYPVVGRD